MGSYKLSGGVSRQPLDLALMVKVRGDCCAFRNRGSIIEFRHGTERLLGEESRLAMFCSGHIDGAVFNLVCKATFAGR